jgi:late competence protein required for DNA uptake (superfamily II DNA/RNA helicase)
METIIETKEIECTRCGESDLEELMWVGDLCEHCRDDMHS